MITPDSFERFSRDISGAPCRAREVSAPDLTRFPNDERIFDATGTLRTEQELAAAVLNQAMADLRRFRYARDGAGREVYADAVSWFRANNGDWPYSFINVCQVLDLSAVAVLECVFVDADRSWFSRMRCKAYALARLIKRAASALFAGDSSALPMSALLSKRSRT